MSTKTIKNLPATSKYIDCIKFVRGVTLMGLKDAKDLVDSMRTSGNYSIICKTGLSVHQIKKLSDDMDLGLEWKDIDKVVTPVDPKAVPKVEEIESKGSQLFNVPNNEEGLEFLKLARKFKNGHRFATLRKKGRGKNRPKSIGGDLRTAEAEWFAVYPEENEDYRKEQFEISTKRSEESEDYLLRHIRVQIAMEQIENGAIMPEVIELLRKKIREEEKARLIDRLRS